MTTTPVPTITDEQIAEIEAACERRCNYPAASILALISRLRAAERDSARYQHLIESGHFVPSSFGNRWALRMSGDAATKPELDAVIDTAMKGDQQ